LGLFKKFADIFGRELMYGSWVELRRPASGAGRSSSITCGSYRGYFFVVKFHRQ